MVRAPAILRGCIVGDNKERVMGCNATRVVFVLKGSEMRWAWQGMSMFVGSSGFRLILINCGEVSKNTAWRDMKNTLLLSWEQLMTLVARAHRGYLVRLCVFGVTCRTCFGFRSWVKMWLICASGSG